jgi:hypothetical protein
MQMNDCLDIWRVAVGPVLFDLALIFAEVEEKIASD